jgi:hypothetical protein
MGQRINHGKRTLKSIYRTYVDVLGFTISDNKRFQHENEDRNNQNEDMNDLENDDEEV